MVLKKIVMLVHCVDGGSMFALIRCIAFENSWGFMFVSPSLVYVEWLLGVSPHSHESLWDLRISLVAGLHPVGFALTKLCSVDIFSNSCAVVAIAVLYFCLIVLMMTDILFLSKTGIWISYSSSRVWKDFLLLMRIRPVSSVL